MQRILVATDMSARSVRAMERGFELAARLGAELRVVSVVDAALESGLADGLAGEVTRQLRAQAEDLGGPVELTAEVAVRIGDPSAAILEAARETDADLVVVGLHRHRPVIDALRETTVERVIRLSHLPVLLVHDAPAGGYARVVCPVDFSAASAAAATAALAVAPGAEVTLFHAFHALHTRHGAVSGGDLPFRHEAEAEYAAWIATRPALRDLPEPELIEGALEPAFEEVFARVQPDLIAVGAHSRPPLVRMLVGSFATELIRSPPADVLVCHP